MILSIIIERPPGDKQGPDIQSSLLTTEAACRERGRQEISHNFSDRRVVSGVCRYLGMLPPRSMLQLTTVSDGPMRGILKRHNIVIQRNGSKFTAQSHVNIEIVK